ncbi:MAG: protein translocase subunit SecDF [Cyclobacteriaceae bacterium]
MRNKGGVVFLTIVISLLCIYYLSFTFVSQGIQKDATEYSRDTNGNLEYVKRQQYLDSIWRTPVYNLFGVDYTYQDIKETELNLGLDLQGGMHVTLEVSPIDIIKGLSGNNQDADFLKSLTDAQNAIRGTQLNFVDEFYAAFQQNASDKSLASIFATASNRGRISFDSGDDVVLDVINTEVESAIDRSFNILRTRIDRFGTSQPNIQRLQGTGRIQVELPGVDNPQRVRKLLQGVAKLEFWEVNEINETGQTLQAMNDVYVAQQQAAGGTLDLDVSSEDDASAGDLSDLLSEDEPTEADAEVDTSDLAGDLAESESDLNEDLNSTVSPLFTKMQQGYGMVYDTRDTAQINRILQNPEVQSVIPPTIKFLWAVKPLELENDLSNNELLELYAIRMSRGGRAPLTGEVITDARQDLDQSTRPSISMQMNADGAKKWKRMTSENIGKRIAIVLDNYVYSAPMVQGEIPNGNSQITGNFTLDEAKDLANILKAGTLPAPTTIVEDVVIGPTLGKVAQNQGITSILAGLGIVIVFMAIYYSGGGLIAVVALFFNVFFILGILAQLAASLTLPGIAGIVLTIGMSIDANVLIFERIKEEIRNGVGLRQAISAGYDKAYSSIIDANVTTLLTGIILYSLGQGPVKGFAVTLIIGIICSFFSAVFITRVIVEAFVKKGDQSKLSFSLPFSANLFTNINKNFIGKRKMAYIFSGTFITVGIVAMIVNGLVFGVDFTGGRSYVVSFTDPVVPSEMRAALSTAFDGKGVEVKTFGATNTVKITTSFMINDESDDADEQVRAKLISGLEGYSGLTYTPDDTNVNESNFAIASSSKVGATIADDIKNSSYQSGVLALIAIFLYILVRFRKWQFSLGAVVALFHDTLFVLSAFAIVGLFGITYEIDQVFIASILSIIGYSINDTVVVFDRVRENMALKAGSDKITVFNEALNKTLNRTVITSVTTLIVVIVLFTFGGPSLQGFSFAFIVGILIGTYSSIFIATPIVIDLDSQVEKRAKAVA